MTEEWIEGTLADAVRPVDERAGSDLGVDLVLSVTEKRGIIPQTEVYTKRVATADVSKYKVLHPFDIAYNPYLLWTNAVGQWLGHGPGVTSPIYECFRVRGQNEPRFWGLVLESGLLTPYFDSTAVGSIQRRRRTTVSTFLAAPVVVPPLAVQGRIVDVMVAVDAHIAHLETEIMGTADLARGLRDGLTLGEGDSVVLGEVIREISGGRSPATNGTTPGPDTEGVLKVSAVRPLAFDPLESKELPASHSLTPQMEVRSGDVLITRANTPDRVGAVCRVPQGVRRGLYLCDKTLRITPDIAVVDPVYLVHALNSSEARQHLTSSATGTSKSMYNVSQGKIRSTPLRIPPLDRQRELAAVLEAAAACVRGLEAERASVAFLRSRLLQGLVSREIDIPEAYDVLLDAGVA